MVNIMVVMLVSEIKQLQVEEMIKTVFEMDKKSTANHSQEA